MPRYSSSCRSPYTSGVPCTGRFWLVVLACALYIGGGFLVTTFVNAPMAYQLASVDPDAPAGVLAEARDAYEGPWNFWNGVRAVFSTLAFAALIGACVLREEFAGKVVFGFRGEVPTVRQARLTYRSATSGQLGE